MALHFPMFPAKLQANQMWCFILIRLIHVVLFHSAAVYMSTNMWAAVEKYCDVPAEIFLSKYTIGDKNAE